MSIENCPLSQIPTEIVAGGPSLVIQVNCSLWNLNTNSKYSIYNNNRDEDSDVLRYSEVSNQ